MSLLLKAPLAFLGGVGGGDSERELALDSESSESEGDRFWNNDGRWGVIVKDVGGKDMLIESKLLSKSVVSEV